MNYTIWEKTPDAPWKKIRFGRFDAGDALSLNHTIWADIPTVTTLEAEKTYKSYLYTDDRDEPTPQKPFVRTPPADGIVVFDVMSMGDIQYSEHGRIPTKFLGVAIQAAYIEAVAELKRYPLVAGDSIHVKVPSVYCE